jgi:hypothetical protein
MFFSRENLIRLIVILALHFYFAAKIQYDQRKVIQLLYNCIQLGPFISNRKGLN